VLLLLLLLLLLLQNLYSAQIQATSSQRRWCGKVGNVTISGALKNMQYTYDLWLNWFCQKWWQCKRNKLKEYCWICERSYMLKIHITVELLFTKYDDRIMKLVVEKSSNNTHRDTDVMP